MPVEAGVDPLKVVVHGDVALDDCDVVTALTQVLVPDCDVLERSIVQQELIQRFGLDVLIVIFLQLQERLDVICLVV